MNEKLAIKKRVRGTAKRFPKYKPVDKQGVEKITNVISRQQIPKIVIR